MEAMSVTTMERTTVEIDPLDFAESLKSMADPVLLSVYDSLSMQRLRVLIGCTFIAEKTAEDDLYIAYKEIKHRMAVGQWCPKKPRVKRTWR